MIGAEIKKITWWYWLATDVFLIAGVAGNAAGFKWALFLTGWQIAYFAFKQKSFMAFPVQLRFAILLLFVLAYAPPMRWLYWLPLAGITVMLLTGYCLMARLLMLLPWNRGEAISLVFIKKIFLTYPVSGSVQQLSVKKDNSMTTFKAQRKK